MVEVKFNVIREIDIRRYLQNRTDIDIERYLKLCDVVNRLFRGRFTQLLYAMITTDSNKFMVYDDIPFTPDLPGLEDQLKVCSQIKELINTSYTEEEIIIYNSDLFNETDLGLCRRIGVFNSILEELGDDVPSKDVLETYFDLCNFIDAFESEYLLQDMEDNTDAIFYIVNKFDLLELVLCV